MSMIICPNCKEEIEDDSHFCDQCGQGLVYCSQCGRVGMGRRCTQCGGLMISAEEKEKQQQQASVNKANDVTGKSLFTTDFHNNYTQPPVMSGGIPTLTLYNSSLDIRIVGINGAVIGRRQGPYQELFVNNMYISGTHAQLIYKADSGWCIIDKHSSNGTKLNQRSLLPDIPMSIKSGDIVSLANVNLQVTVM